MHVCARCMIHTDRRVLLSACRSAPTTRTSQDFARLIEEAKGAVALAKTVAAEAAAYAAYATETATAAVDAAASAYQAAYNTQRMRRKLAAIQLASKAVITPRRQRARKQFPDRRQRERASPAAVSLQASPQGEGSKPPGAGAK